METLWVAPRLTAQPTPRSGHTATCVDGRIYCFGGLVDGGLFVNDLNVLDFSSRKWSQSTLYGEKPRARAFHSTVEYEGSLYIFGGRNNSTVYNDLYEYNTKAHTCKRIIYSHDQPNPPRLFEHRAVVLDDLMIVYGGFNKLKMGKLFDEIWTFDFKTRIWKKLTMSNVTRRDENMPGPRASHAMVVCDKRIYLVGGIEDEDKTLAKMNEVWELNLRPLKWRQLPVQTPVFPPPRKGMLCFGVGRNFIVACGSNNRETSSRFPSHFNDVWYFETSGRIWRRLDKDGGTETSEGESPAPRSNPAYCMFVHEGHMKVFVNGGEDKDGKALDDSWLYNVDYCGIVSMSCVDLSDKAILAPQQQEIDQLVVEKEDKEEDSAKKEVSDPEEPLAENLIEQPFKVESPGHGRSASGLEASDLDSESSETSLADEIQGYLDENEYEKKGASTNNDTASSHRDTNDLSVDGYQSAQAGTAGDEHHSPKRLNESILGRDESMSLLQETQRIVSDVEKEMKDTINSVSEQIIEKNKGLESQIERIESNLDVLTESHSVRLREDGEVISRVVQKVDTLSLRADTNEKNNEELLRLTDELKGMIEKLQADVNSIRKDIEGVGVEDLRKLNDKLDDLAEKTSSNNERIKFCETFADKEEERSSSLSDEIEELRRSVKELEDAMVEIITRSENSSPECDSLEDVVASLREQFSTFQNKVEMINDELRRMKESNLKDDHKDSDDSVSNEDKAGDNSPTALEPPTGITQQENEEMAKLHRDMSDIKLEHDRLSHSFGVTQETLQSLSAALDETKEKVETCLDEQRRLEAATHHDSTTELGEPSATFEKEMAAVSQSVEQLSANVAHSHETLETKVDELTKSVVSLEGRVCAVEKDGECHEEKPQLDTSSDIESIRTSTTEIREKLSDLEKKCGDAETGNNKLELVSKTVDEQHHLTEALATQVEGVLVRTQSLEERVDNVYDRLITTRERDNTSGDIDGNKRLDISERITILEEKVESISVLLSAANGEPHRDSLDGSVRVGPSEPEADVTEPCDNEEEIKDLEPAPEGEDVVEDKTCQGGRDNMEEKLAEALSFFEGLKEKLQVIIPALERQEETDTTAEELKNNVRNVRATLGEVIALCATQRNKIKALEEASEKTTREMNELRSFVSDIATMVTKSIQGQASGQVTHQAGVNNMRDALQMAKQPQNQTQQHYPTASRMQFIIDGTNTDHHEASTVSSPQLDTLFIPSIDLTNSAAFQGITQQTKQANNASPTLYETTQHLSQQRMSLHEGTDIDYSMRYRPSNRVFDYDSPNIASSTNTEPVMFTLTPHPGNASTQRASGIAYQVEASASERKPRTVKFADEALSGSELQATSSQVFRSRGSSLVLNGEGNRSSGIGTLSSSLLKSALLGQPVVSSQLTSNSPSRAPEDIVWDASNCIQAKVYDVTQGGGAVDVSPLSSSRLNPPCTCISRNKTNQSSHFALVGANDGSAKVISVLVRNSGSPQAAQSDSVGSPKGYTVVRELATVSLPSNSMADTSKVLQCVFNSIHVVCATRNKLIIWRRDSGRPETDQRYSFVVSTPIPSKEASKPSKVTAMTLVDNLLVIGHLDTPKATSIQVLDLSDMSVVACTGKGHVRSINNIVAVPSQDKGRLTMVSAGSDHRAIVWQCDVATGTMEMLGVLKDRDNLNAVTRVAVSQQYMVVATGHKNGTVGLWSLNDFTFLTHLSTKVSQDGEDEGAPLSVVGLDFNGKFLVVVCESGVIHLWDADAAFEHLNPIVGRLPPTVSADILTDSVVALTDAGNVFVARFY